MDFEVVIAGSDINAYHMARSYYDLYGKKAYLISKEKMGVTSISKIVEYAIEEPKLWETETFKKTLEAFALKHNDKKLLLIGTHDVYVRLIVENREFLSKYYTFNYVALDLLNKLLIKDNFYPFAEANGLDIPNTYIYQCGSKKKIKHTFSYPLILKPGNGVDYYNHPFEGMSKVYKITSKKELSDVIKTIESHGYKGNLIIQEFIPGDDTALYDVVFYCGKDKKAKVVAYAHILLQERSRSAVGNAAALITDYNEELMLKLKAFMEKIGYQGLAEFDLRYDYRDQKFKVLEINPRQGRCSFYVTACGHNLMKYLIDDLILNEEQPFSLVNEKLLMTFVPKYVLQKYVLHKDLVKTIKTLYRKRKVVDPLNYKKDNLLKRKIYLFLRKINYIRKFKKNTW